MKRVLVIGAGIIGLSCADTLLDEGFEVTVIDRDPAGDKASFGNAGGIGVSEVVPASVPGLVWKIPRWLADPLGPLSLKPGHFPSMAPWLWRFLRAGRASEVERITKSLAVLCNRADADFRAMLGRLELSGDIHGRGALTVYESDEGFHAEQKVWKLKRRHGVEWQILSGSDARDLEPALGPIVRHAVMVPGWSHLSDPKRVVDRLRADVARRGARIAAGEAIGFDGNRLVTRDGGRLAFDLVVVAAGAWSARLAASIGDRAILESERGYNTTLPRPGVNLTREVIFAERQFVATPMEMGLRIGGAAEFAGLDAPPNYKRSKALVDLARLYFPQLDETEGKPWMGHRPTTPDSLPVIGSSPRRKDILYAFGHGHTGLTLGPTTALLVADLATHRTPRLDLSPYAINRFERPA